MAKAPSIKNRPNIGSSHNTINIRSRNRPFMELSCSTPAAVLAFTAILKVMLVQFVKLCNPISKLLQKIFSKWVEGELYFHISNETSEALKHVFEPMQYSCELGQKPDAHLITMIESLITTF
jgi:hypothetical protein